MIISQLKKIFPIHINITKVKISQMTEFCRHPNFQDKIRLKSGQNRPILMVFSLFLTYFWPFDLGRRQNLVIWPILTLVMYIGMENV